MDALIVDDELFCRENLKVLVETHCPEIIDVRCADSAEAARKIIAERVPALLFLDVQMPRETGFDLLEDLDAPEMHVVFVTAHNEFALRALKAEAVDYLEKPIDIEQLKDAVLKVSKRREKQNTGEQWQDLLRQARQLPGEEKIAIPMRDGFEWVSYKDIIHLEAAESYTTLYLVDNRKMVSSKNIAVYERKLDDRVFFRTHKSHIVNVRDHLKSFNRVDGNSAVMSNGKHVPISRRKAQEFIHSLIGEEA